MKSDDIRMKIEPMTMSVLVAFAKILRRASLEHRESRRIVNTNANRRTHDEHVNHGYIEGSRREANNSFQTAKAIVFHSMAKDMGDIEIVQRVIENLESRLQWAREHSDKMNDLNQVMSVPIDILNGELGAEDMARGILEKISAVRNEISFVSSNEMIV